MKTLTRCTVFALVGALTVCALSVPVAVATPPQKLLLAPGEPNGPFFPLPKFGFSSFNTGFGERVTFVKPNSRAARLGLQPGDVIFSLNGIPLRYRGSWGDALRQAVLDGGRVTLRIRDVNTGRIAFRQTFVGGFNGPIVDNNLTDCPPEPIAHHRPYDPDFYGAGYRGPGNNYGTTVYDFVRLFTEKKP